jgi:hypothetical protein
MWHAKPIKDLLFLLRSYAIVLVHKVEERALGLFEGCIGARLQVAQIRKYPFLELF